MAGCPSLIHVPSPSKMVSSFPPSTSSNKGKFPTCQGLEFPFFPAPACPLCWLVHLPFVPGMDKGTKINREDFCFLVHIVASLYPFRKNYKVLLPSSFRSLLATMSANPLFSAWTKQHTKCENTDAYKVTISYCIFSVLNTSSPVISESH